MKPKKKKVVEQEYSDSESSSTMYSNDDTDAIISGNFTHVTAAVEAPLASVKSPQEITNDDDDSTSPRNPDGTPWKNTLKGWTNPPSKKTMFKGTKIIMRIPERSDCWRKTCHRFVQDNAPYHWQKVTGDFKATVKVSGAFSEMYQKAGIMVRLDAENWILTGMEHFGNRVHHSTVYTVDYTDWTLTALPPNSENTGVWFCLKRVGNTYEAFYSLDNQKWILTRQGQFTERPVLYVGLCGASPTSLEYRVTFDYYSCTSAV